MSLVTTGILLSSHYVTILAETSNPNTTPPKAPNDNSVTPGVWGFIAIFLVGLATVFIIVDMTRRVRRVRYRGEIREQIEAEREEAAREAAGLDDELRSHSAAGDANGPASGEPRDDR